MNEQQIRQTAIEFGNWIAKNTNLPDNIINTQGYKKIKSAKDENSLLEGVLSLSEELKDNFKTLCDQFTKEKQNIPMSKNGSKIDYLVNKFTSGGENPMPIEVHNAWENTPRGLSFIAAYLSGKSKTLPKRKGTTVERSFARIQYPDGTIVDRIHREDNNGNTYRTITPKRDTTYEYNGELFVPGEEMYNRYENAWKQYGVYKNGGSIEKFQNSGKIELRDAAKRSTKEGAPINYYYDENGNKHIVVHYPTGSYGYGIIGNDTIPYKYNLSWYNGDNIERIYKPTHARAIINDVNKKDSLYGDDPNLGKTHFGYNKWGELVFIPGQKYMYDESPADGPIGAIEQSVTGVDGSVVGRTQSYPKWGKWVYFDKDGLDVGDFGDPIPGRRDSLRKVFYERINDPNTYSWKLHSINNK